MILPNIVSASEAYFWCAGYQYDPATGLYYDANTRFFYDSNAQVGHARAFHAPAMHGYQSGLFCLCLRSCHCWQVSLEGSFGSGVQ